MESLQLYGDQTIPEQLRKRVGKHVLAILYPWFPLTGGGGGGGAVKAKINKISRSATDCHLKTSISETKGTKGVKYTFSESSVQDLLKN